MKKLRLLSLVGITSIALAHAGWAGPHGGGGGGGGGGCRGGGGGSFRSGGFGGAPRFAGGGFSAPYAVSRGAAYRGGGVGFGAYHPSTAPAQVRSSVPSRSSVVQISEGRSTRSVTNVGRGN